MATTGVKTLKEHEIIEGLGKKNPTPKQLAYDILAMAVHEINGNQPDVSLFIKHHDHLKQYKYFESVYREIIKRLQWFNKNSENTLEHTEYYLDLKAAVFFIVKLWPSLNNYETKMLSLKAQFAVTTAKSIMDWTSLTISNLVEAKLKSGTYFETIKYLNQLTYDLISVQYIVYNLIESFHQKTEVTQASKVCSQIDIGWFQHAYAYRVQISKILENVTQDSLDALHQSKDIFFEKEWLAPYYLRELTAYHEQLEFNFKQMIQQCNAIKSHSGIYKDVVRNARMKYDSDISATEQSASLALKMTDQAILSWDRVTPIASYVKIILKAVVPIAKAPDKYNRVLIRSVIDTIDRFIETFLSENLLPAVLIKERLTISRDKITKYLARDSEPLSLTSDHDDKSSANVCATNTANDASLELEHTEESLAAMKEQLAQAQQALEQLRIQHSEAIKVGQQKDEAIAQLTQQATESNAPIQALKQAHTELECELGDAKRQLNSLQNTYAQSTMKTRDLSKRLHATRLENSSMTSEITPLKNGYDDLAQSSIHQSNLIGQKHVEDEQNQKRLDSLRQQSKCLLQSQKMLNNQARQQKGATVELNRDIKQLNQEIDQTSVEIVDARTHKQALQKERAHLVHSRAANRR